MIEKIASRFKTADGQEHPTWNAARRHQTGLDLAETIRSADPRLSNAETLAFAILQVWHVSRRGVNTNRTRGTIHPSSTGNG